jgi:LysR family glycine cleavage system transcriptional activator
MRNLCFMQTLRYQLPPPNALVTFEAAARHLSFTAAAAEMNVTRVAVSRQIKALEENLGTALFRRLHKRLSLTPDGAEYYQSVSRALKSIAASTGELRRRKPSNRITVTTTVGFSSYWLMPRIGSFRKQYPEIDIRVLVSDIVINLQEEGIDVAVRYGAGNWPQSRVTFLLQEEIFPTCSETYFKCRQSLREPRDLLNETLLHLEGPYDEQVTWRWWFESQGIEGFEKRSGFAVNSYSHLVQAVLEGQGIALVGPPLLTPYFRKGILMRPIDVPAVRRKAFHLVVPAEQAPSQGVDAFCKWVIGQTRS